MEIEHIDEFLTLATYLSFSESAEKLNMTQSTLSKHIKALENELGAELFTRSSRSVYLSEFGRIFLPHAMAISEAAKAASKAVEAYLHDSAATFRIPIVRNSQYYDIDKILVDFRRRFPNYTVNVMETDVNEAFDLFKEGKVNLFATYGEDKESKAYGFIQVGASEIVAVLPETYPIEAASEISIERLRSAPLLLPSRDTKASKMIIAALKAASPEFVPNIVFQGGSFGSIELVQAGMGIALQPRELVENYAGKGVRYVSINPPIRFAYGLGYRKGNSLSRAEQCFVRYLKEYASTIKLS